MDKALLAILMDQNTLANGKIINRTAKESPQVRMEVTILECIRMAREVVKAPLQLLMEVTLLECIRMASPMVSEL